MVYCIKIAYHSETAGNGSYYKIFRVPFSDLKRCMCPEKSSESDQKCKDWNAQVSQSFLKGKPLTVSLQLYDVLGNKSSFSHSFTADSRSDSWHNGINNYAMLHVIYRFNAFGGKNARGGFGGPGGRGGDMPGPPPGVGGRGGRGGFGGGGFGGGRGRF